MNHGAGRIHLLDNYPKNCTYFQNLMYLCIVTEVANAPVMHCNAGDSEMTDLGLKVSSISILPKPKRSLATFLSSTTSYFKTNICISLQCQIISLERSIWEESWDYNHILKKFSRSSTNLNVNVYLTVAYKAPGYNMYSCSSFVCKKVLLLWEALCEYKKILQGIILLLTYFA